MVQALWCVCQSTAWSHARQPICYRGSVQLFPGGEAPLSLPRGCDRRNSGCRTGDVSSDYTYHQSGKTGPEYHTQIDGKSGRIASARQENPMERFLSLSELKFEYFIRKVMF